MQRVHFRSLHVFFKFNFQLRDYCFEEINWILNKRRTRITKNLINAAAFNRVNTVCLLDFSMVGIILAVGVGEGVPGVKRARSLCGELEGGSGNSKVEGTAGEIGKSSATLRNILQYKKHKRIGAIHQ